VVIAASGSSRGHWLTMPALFSDAALTAAQS
jgi:hypothetical protein